MPPPSSQTPTARWFLRRRLPAQHRNPEAMPLLTAGWRVRAALAGAPVRRFPRGGTAHRSQSAGHPTPHHHRVRHGPHELTRTPQDRTTSLGAAAMAGLVVAETTARRCRPHGSRARQARIPDRLSGPIPESRSPTATRAWPSALRPRRDSGDAWTTVTETRNGRRRRRGVTAAMPLEQLQMTNGATTSRAGLPPRPPSRTRHGGKIGAFTTTEEIAPGCANTMPLCGGTYHTEIRNNKQQGRCPAMGRW